MKDEIDVFENHKRRLQLTREFTEILQADERFAGGQYRCDAAQQGVDVTARMCLAGAWRSVEEQSTFARQTKRVQFIAMREEVEQIAAEDRFDLWIEDVSSLVMFGFGLNVTLISADSK